MLAKLWRLFWKNRSKSAGFKIVAMESYSIDFHKLVKLLRSYTRETLFTIDLCAYLSSGPIIAVILEKDNSSRRFQNFDRRNEFLQMQLKSTIRKIFATSIEANAVMVQILTKTQLLEGAFLFCSTERRTLIATIAKPIKALQNGVLFLIFDQLRK